MLRRILKTVVCISEISHLYSLLNKFTKAMHDPWWMNKTIIQQILLHFRNWIDHFPARISQWLSVFSSCYNNCGLSTLPSSMNAAYWYCWRLSFVYDHLNTSRHRGGHSFFFSTLKVYATFKTIVFGILMKFIDRVARVDTFQIICLN